ncbi:MAG: hypothetical protein ABJA78_08260 [Ferruginibacter sp.]
MKFVQIFLSAAIILFMVPARAQTTIPKGFSKGNIILSDSSILTGYIKDNMKKDASILFINEKGEDKKTFAASDINGAGIDNNSFVCIKGDFFKVISRGELSFLQKSSDASGKPSYNGAEAIFVSGTAGKIGDYFIYNNSSKQLDHVSKKNLSAVAGTAFTGCPAAIEKAGNAQADIALLKDAVDVFNNRNTK